MESPIIIIKVANGIDQLIIDPQLIGRIARECGVSEKPEKIITITDPITNATPIYAIVNNNPCLAGLIAENKIETLSTEKYERISEDTPDLIADIEIEESGENNTVDDMSQSCVLI